MQPLQTTCTNLLLSAIENRFAIFFVWWKLWPQNVCCVNTIWYLPLCCQLVLISREFVSKFCKYRSSQEMTDVSGTVEYCDLHCITCVPRFDEVITNGEKSRRLYLGCGHTNRIESSRVESDLAKVDSQILTTRFASLLDLPTAMRRKYEGTLCQSKLAYICGFSLSHTWFD
jgi:hypothetical protein